MHLFYSDEPTGRLALVFELMDCNMYEAIKGYYLENIVRLQTTTIRNESEKLHVSNDEGNRSYAQEQYFS
jgi:renal tumor antigen